MVALPFPALPFPFLSFPPSTQVHGLPKYGHPRGAAVAARGNQPQARLHTIQGGGYIIIIRIRSCRVYGVLVLVLVYGVLVPVYGGENAALDTPTRRRLPVRVHPCLCDDKPGYKYAGSSQADDFGGGTRLVGLLLLHGTRGRGRGSPLLVEQAKQACRTWSLDTRELSRVALQNTYAALFFSSSPSPSSSSF